MATAEDALADAFATALERWPVDGVPERPEAWLFTVARRRMLDGARHGRVRQEAGSRMLLAAEEAQARFEAGDELPDQRLGLLFACAHPAIDESVRTPLMLQAVLGLDAARIASAFLVAPSAMGQRLVRAKRKIADARIPFAVPEATDLAPRLDAVLAAIYAAYTLDRGEEGADSLAIEAMWLAELVAAALPSEPEALALLALLLFDRSRRPARRREDGSYVPLAEQDTTSWDGASIAAAESLLKRAASAARIGRFQLEAAIQSVHAARRTSGRTDWPAIVRLYGALQELTGSPVIALNRAVAMVEAGDVRGGLAALRALDDQASLADYQPYWAARAAVLARAGDLAGARAAYRQALGLTEDEGSRRFLAARLEALD